MVNGRACDERGHQVWPHPFGDRDAHAGEDHERCPHGRHRVPDERASGDAESERERGVADRHDAAGIEMREGPGSRREVE